MPNQLTLVKFKDVDLSDPFFDSLKSQYEEFSEWFTKKADENVFIVEDEGGHNLLGFVYLKQENGAITDVNPPLPAAKRLKVGTMKLIPHGTKLGERVIKKIFDTAISMGVDEIYVTVFDTHASLINLFKRYGFVSKGVKNTPNGTENVLCREMGVLAGDTVKDYPLISTAGANFFLLAIYPEYHSNLFPDSILHNEDMDIIKDVSFTNTIHKVYVAKLALTRLQPGDVVVIYRTTDIDGAAYYRSVATSVCVVQEAKSRRDFADVNAFLSFAKPHSIFTDEELVARYNDGERLYAVKMTYNVALSKRPNRKALLEIVGIPEQPRWDLKSITRDQFDIILELGKVDESVVVD